MSCCVGLDINHLMHPISFFHYFVLFRESVDTIFALAEMKVDIFFIIFVFFKWHSE